MASDIWTSFYWSDYNRDTENLTVTEHGAYFLLLKHYYFNRGPISANAERLLLVCRAVADYEKAAVMMVLAKFFVKDGDTYRHARCDKEIAKAIQLSEKRRDAGKKGAIRSNGNRSANATAIAEQLPTQSQTQSQKEEKQPTKDLSLRELAHGICQLARIPATSPNLDVVQAAFEIKSPDELKAAVEKAVSEGKTLNRFWFENGGFNDKAPEPPKPKAIPLHLKVRAEMEAERQEKAARRVN